MGMREWVRLRRCPRRWRRWRACFRNPHLGHLVQQRPCHIATLSPVLFVFQVALHIHKLGTSRRINFGNTSYSIPRESQFGHSPLARCHAQVQSGSHYTQWEQRSR
ncbi:hypothetical protein AG1IA_04583 [Rhizoctonia solani AG-1 IA]|uniref:Uncharacterized protein n=1 Tax=Thanatephorus cucumeris (strain AG1-IA) TaxID=983506 RepID=L8WYF7_THACA|nr:hypothetical protein AG1IA_04583 [Rhizoctonia solani AG-1 IA]